MTKKKLKKISQIYRRSTLTERVVTLVFFIIYKFKNGQFQKRSLCKSSNTFSVYCLFLGDVSNVTCAILEVPTKLEEENLNEKLRWVMW